MRWLRKWHRHLSSGPMTIEPHTVTKKLAETAQRIRQARMAQLAGSGPEARETAAEPATTQDTGSSTAAEDAHLLQSSPPASASEG
jgi:hypothetical protein